MDQNLYGKILVLGSTGKTGSRVFERLKSLGYTPKGASRNSNPTFDWYDSSTWNSVLKGCKAVYITFQPDLAVPGAPEIIYNFSQRAVTSGVERFVLLSGRGEVEAQQCEKIIADAGVQWTVVRSSWFNQNFSEGSFLDSIRARYIALPVGNVCEPFVDADDLADVVVAALTENKHNGKIYDVTGPQLLTFQEAVNEIATATGESIAFQQISVDEYSTMLRRYQVPDEYIQLLTYLFTEVLDGRNAYLAKGVEEALGRKPHTFTEFANKAAISGVWLK